MTIENTENTENTEAVDTQVQAEEGSTSVDNSSDVSTKEPSDEIPSEGKEAEAYKPNYKYSVKDQEYEMDEWLRPLVKDAETEKKFRDLYTKAHGINDIKEQREQLRNDFDQYKTQVEKTYSPVVQNYQRMSHLLKESRDTGDYGQFFQALNVPVKEILQWSANTVAQLEQNPNYLQQIKQGWDQTQTQYTLEQRMQQYEQQNRQLQNEIQTRDLEYSLSTPEIQSFAQSFDARVGKPGAFREEVIKRGAIIEQTQQRTLSASEIAKEIMNIYGPQAQPAGSTSTQTQTVQSSEGKPVIPRVNGRGGSYVKSAPQSIADLRKLSAQNRATV